MKILKTLPIVAGVVVLAPQVANADDPTDYSWSDNSLQSKYGISTTLGGGITGFTNKTMRDAVSSDVGGLWDLRVAVGSHMPLAFEAGYIGTAANIDALIGTQSGTLVGTTVEGAVRYNVLPHYAFTPFAFAGIGWQRYDITGANFTLSDSGVNESDNSVVFPMGAGVAYRTEGLVVDLRGTFRPNTNQDLVLQNAGTGNANNDKFAPMHAWEASAAIGYEF